MLVTLILNRLMSVRAKRERLEKLNMVIGTFFSEVGVELLKQMAASDEEIERIHTHLVVTANWHRQTSRPCMPCCVHTQGASRLSVLI